ncbi:MAG: response regulator [Hespellia sp.]|nr:response regulator [Hespellia sp.]
MPLKLLIADDEEVIRNGVAKYVQLHTERFEQIYEAENGQEAIDLMLAYQPDMMLLDVQMPQKTGINVMEEARRAGLSPITVILSGYDEFQYAQQAIRFGAKEYLLKPVRAKDILECLMRLADEHFGVEENEHKDVSQNQLVKKAEEYILEHYMESITLNEIAETLGVSKGYVSTLFTQNKQCGFVDYLNGVRVERACSYLEQNYFKIYEIAYKVGFQDEKYFTKVFKKIKAMSPKEYRMKHR